MGATFAPTRFSLVRISIRDLVADGKSLVRNSGVGDGGQNRILSLCAFFASNSRFMSLFQVALDTPLGNPFSASLSVHGLHFTVCAPSNFWLECMPQEVKMQSCGSMVNTSSLVAFSAVLVRLRHVAVGLRRVLVRLTVVKL